MGFMKIGRCAQRCGLLGVLLMLLGTGAAGQVLTGARTSSFTYKPNGMLDTETVEPSIANLCVTTTHFYDTSGNATSTSSANCPGAAGDPLSLFTTRSSATAAYAAQSLTVAGTVVSSPAGMFATSVTNVLGHQEDRVYDPRFGVAISVNGPNGLVTKVDLDDFGRPVKETRADGTTTTTIYCILKGMIVDRSSNSVGCSDFSLTYPSNEIPTGALTYVESRSFKSDGLVLGPVSRTYMDRAGRVLRQISESFDGPDQPTSRRYVAKDTYYDALGRARGSSAPYFLYAGSSTVAGANDAGSSYSVVDLLGRVTQVDVVDPKGHYTVVTASGATVTSSRTTTAYNGLSITVTNDKGQTRTEERYANGKTARVTDHYGAQVAYEYDAFGNLTLTRDALQNLVKVYFDTRGRKRTVTDPDSGMTVYDYNALGELVRQRTAAQQVAGTATTMSYDTLGRLTQRVEPEYTTNWYYDKRQDGSTCMDPVAGTTKVAGAGKLCETNTSQGVNRKYKFDALGRAVQARTTITNGPSFGTALSYDTTSSRLLSQVYPTGLQLNYAYSTKGYLTQVKLASPVTVAPLPATPGGAVAPTVTLAANTALWTAGKVNAWGSSESESLANGVSSQAQFEAATGRLLGVTAGLTASPTTVLNQSYTWDSLGNLATRNDANGDGSTGAVSETFSYDSINRLSSYVVNAPQIPSLSRTVNLDYNAIGNLLFKSDVGNYTYPLPGNVGGVSNALPHAVSSIVGNASFGTISYGYDTNGNVTTANGGKWRSVAYTSFNLPDGTSGMAGVGGSPRYTWQYDESHQRIRETRVNASGTRTTWFMHPDNLGGLSFEHEVSPTGTLNNRHYIAAGSQTIVLVTTAALPTLAATQLAPAAIPTTTTVAAVKIEYWHKDHLGSLTTTTDQQGNVTARYAYDPFGKRRYTNGQYDPFGSLVIDWVPTLNAGTDRGFTGHEHLDDLGVVHMNGRIFEPTIARFMQADPLIQDPGNLQSYNRYSYAWNNPLNATDPSGFCVLNCSWQSHNAQRTVENAAGKVMRWAHYNMPGQKAIDAYIMNHRWAYQVGQIVVTVVAAYYGGPSAGAGASATWASYYTYQQTGDPHAAMKAGAIAFATYLAFNGAGSISNPAGNIFAHAVVGCASAEASGGDCGKGALSAGVGAAWSQYGYEYPGNPRTDMTALAANTAIHAMVGGVTSVLGGGKFADGAKMAAFGYLFNYIQHLDDGNNAHRTIQAWAKRQGLSSEIGLNGPDGLLVGRADIVDFSSDELWEVKPGNARGVSAGDKQLDRYTNGTGYSRGEDMRSFAVGSSMTLSGINGDRNSYVYTNVGKGLVTYQIIRPPSAFDIVLQQLGRAIRNAPPAFSLPTLQPVPRPD